MPSNWGAFNIPIANRFNISGPDYSRPNRIRTLAEFLAPAAANMRNKIFSKTQPFPPLGEAVDDGRGLVAGELEVDELLLVEALGGLLQKLNLSAVVLD